MCTGKGQWGDLAALQTTGLEVKAVMNFPAKVDLARRVVDRR